MQEVEPAETTVLQDTVYVDFKGQKVVLPFNMNEKTLQFTNAEYLEEFNKKYFRPANSRGVFDLTGDVDITFLKSLMDKSLEKYPQFDMVENSITKFDKLQKDFPDVKSLEDAFEISGIIVSYYDVIIREEIASDAAKIIKNSKKAKVLAFGYSANRMEATYAISNPVAGSKMAGAVALAQQYTDEKFGPNAYMI